MANNDINEVLLDKELFITGIYGKPIILCNYKTAKKLIELSNWRWPNDENKEKYKGFDIYIDEHSKDNDYRIFTLGIRKKFLKLRNFEKRGESIADE